MSVSSPSLLLPVKPLVILHPVLVRPAALKGNNVVSCDGGPAGRKRDKQVACVSLNGAQRIRTPKDRDE
ncbi:hypothetical protein CCR75_008621 [Bremia lactucae]|uniref:Uncharacterized protein n=1 Tax=Bremia lactucae TaxID=4779 RepID=A0A976NZ88_BRELC|nr:hypothetical protein CCR75_008621 [Bremia lactucae]